jgi:exonuclease SbcC
VKPLKLSLQAFGPFRHRLELDFRPLEQRQLFLIHGPVSCGNQTFRIQRSWTDPSEPSVTLWGDDGQLAEGVEKVNVFVQTLLRMSSLEFRRAVIIPQGQFRQFLVADAEEKERILSTVFQTERFADLELRLKSDLLELQEKLRTAWDERERLVGESTAEGYTDFHERLRTTRDRAEALDQELRLSQRLEQDYQSQVGQSAVLQQRSTDLEQARGTLDRLAEKSRGLEHKRVQLERFGKADQIRRYLTQYDEARHGLEHAQQALGTAEKEVEEARRLEEHPDEVLHDFQQSQLQQSEIQRELDRLDQVGEGYRVLQEALHELEDVEADRAELEEQMQQLEVEQADCRHRLEQNLELQGREEQLRQRSQAVRTQLDEVKRSLKRTRQSEEVHSSYTRLSEYVDRTGTRIEELRGRGLALHEELARLEDSLWVGQAASLAARLSPNRACPVCGSPDHPAPAPGVRGETPSPRDLEAKRSQIQQADNLIAKLSKEQNEQNLLLARLAERREMLSMEETSLDGDSQESSREWEQRAHQLTEELRKMERQLHRLDDLEAETGRLRGRLDKLESRRSKSQEALHETELRQVQLQAVVQETRRALGTQRTASFDSVEQIDSLREELRNSLETSAVSFEDKKTRLSQSTNRLAGRIATLQMSQQLCQQAQEKLQLAQELFELQLHRNGFTSREELERSLEGMGPELQQEMRAYEGELQAAQHHFEQVNARLQTSLEQAGPIRGDLGKLRETITRQIEEKAALRAEVVQLEQWVERYHHVVEELQRLDPQLSSLKRLTRACSGDNRIGLSFHRYLLQQLMENVLLAANRRLAELTSNRYSLEAVEHSLDLQVLDQRTVSHRPLSSLSGGEGFLAALALALGMTDSQAVAGPNAALESLFIDEGFGNLDEEALDLALTALTQLEHDARLVGVVSHLPELRQRIPSRIEVLSGPLGSSARVLLD